MTLALGGGEYTFTWLDWAIVIGYLAFTTWFGAKLSGKQQTIRDFFLGGRRLPWYAVAGSIVATEISAVSFVGVPAIIFAAGGNMTYLQLGLGTILARIVIGYWFVPAFYEREIYSPYDYMGRRLGARVKQVISGLFVVGQLLGQGVRVYLTALVLEVVTDGRLNLHASIWIIGAISIAWTIMGGISTVIWTDVLLFLLFFGGATASLFFVSGQVPGGWGEMVSAGVAAGKFRLLNFSGNPTLEFTFWAGVIASTWGSLNAYGTDQLIAQRMFCCRDPKPARWAIIGSSVSILVAACLLFVGVGLFAYYRQRAEAGLARRGTAAEQARFAELASRRDLDPKGKDAAELNSLMWRHAFAEKDAALLEKNRNRVFPIFIVRGIPPGLTGLIVAAIFAAAVSSLDSILAALSQVCVSAYYDPWRRWRLERAAEKTDPEREQRRQIVLSRTLIVLFGLALCGMAYVGIAAEKRFPDILNLALSMAGYTGGALLAGFMLAFLKVPVDERGLVWSAPLSVIAVFGIAWKAPWASWVVLGACAAMLVAWFLLGARGRGPLKAAAMIGAIAAVLALHFYVGVPKPDAALGWPSIGPPLDPFAWPWWVPIGSIVAFAWGWLLAGRRAEPQ